MLLSCAIPHSCHLKVQSSDDMHSHWFLFHSDLPHQRWSRSMDWTIRSQCLWRMGHSVWPWVWHEGGQHCLQSNGIWQCKASAYRSIVWARSWQNTLFKHEVRSMNNDGMMSRSSLGRYFDFTVMIIMKQNITVFYNITILLYSIEGMCQGHPN